MVLYSSKHVNMALTTYIILILLTNVDFCLIGLTRPAAFMYKTMKINNIIYIYLSIMNIIIL